MLTKIDHCMCHSCLVDLLCKIKTEDYSVQRKFSQLKSGVWRLASQLLHLIDFKVTAVLFMSQQN